MQPVTLYRVSLLLLLSIICALYLAAIRPGHDWDDDFALYILHARNLAEGRSYADTGHIFNPEYPGLGPPSYPPGFPILLAPLWALRGLDLMAMKILGMVCFIASLALLPALDKAFNGASLPSAARIVLVALLALCPPFARHVDFIGSDFLFVLLIFVALFFLDRIYDCPSPPLLPALPVAALIFAAYSTRTVGLALIPSLLLFELIRHHRISLSALLASVLAICLCALEFLALDSSGSVPSLLVVDVRRIAVNARIYAGALQHFFLGGQTLSWVLCALFIALALAQVVLQIRSTKRLPIAWIFAILYIAVLLVYQSNEPRFLFPLVPIYFALAIGALERLRRAVASHWVIRSEAVRTAVKIISFSTAATAGFATAYAGLNRQPIREGFLDPEFIQVTEFLRLQTQLPDTILFRKPRVLTLLTHRRALTYALAPGLGDFVHDVQPNYIVVTESPEVGLPSDERFLWPYIREHPEALSLVYRNSEFRVYHVLMW